MKSRGPLVAAIITAVLCTSIAVAADRAALGKTEKLRILVDKVIMAHNKWVMTEDHVKEIADAGFNVVSPRLGNDDMAEVRKIANAAANCGIFHMPWMRGTMIAKGDVKMVWADGTEQELASPNSDELWDWMTDLIVKYAQISVEQPALIGVFLDYENYSPGGEGNCYGLSYDDKILGEFAAARGIALPELSFAERAKWLKSRNLDKPFAHFQISHWRERCRALRRAVDAINPTFQFAFTRAGHAVHDRAAYLEWTRRLPLRSGPTLDLRPAGWHSPHKEALEANRQILLRNMQIARSKKLRFHLRGHWTLSCAAHLSFPGATRHECASPTATGSSTRPDVYPTHPNTPLVRKGQPRHRARQPVCVGFQGTQDAGPRRAASSKQTEKPQIGVFDTRNLMRNMIAADDSYEVLSSWAWPRVREFRRDCPARLQCGAA